MSNQRMTLAQEDPLGGVETTLQMEDRWPWRRHYASALAGCPRRAWYRQRNTDTTHAITLSGYVMMRMGNMVGRWWAEQLDLSARRTPGWWKPLLRRIEAYCPTMHSDIMLAAEREKDDRPYDIARYVTPFTAVEVPFRMTLAGLDYEVGAKVDVVFSGKLHEIPWIAEVKTSHMTRTRMIVDRQILPIDYVMQAGFYATRYPELPAEVHYFDRQTGYPYKIGVAFDDGRLVAQMGGYGKPGAFVSAWLNDMEFQEFVPARLEWVEAMFKEDAPPGEIVLEEIAAPLDKQHGKFYVMKLVGLDHPTWLDEDYHLLVYPDGHTIDKKQANKVKYTKGFCRYCGYRGLCAQEVDMKLIEPADEWRNWKGG